MSLGLVSSLRRTNQYNTGGIIGILAIQTLLDNGARGFTVTRASADAPATAIVPADDNELRLIQPEENSCSFAENLKVGANKYLLHSIAFKYGGVAHATSVAMKALNLGRHSFLVKLKNNTCVLLGENNGLTAEKNDGGAGATNDDLLGYDLTLSGGEIVHAAVMPASVFDTLAATVPAD